MRDRWKKYVCAAGLAGLIVLCLAGCAGSREKYELREAAIRQMESGDYAGAIVTFGEALEKSDGFVGEFELDVLKYRAEAEYRTGDYGAAAHTYDVLSRTDGEKPEYLGRLGVMYALDGQTDKAVETYRRLAAAAEKEEGAKTGTGKGTGKGTEAGTGKGTEKGTEAGSTAGAMAEQVLLLAGEKLTEEGRGGEAEELFREAVDGGRESGAIYNRLALSEMGNGAYDRALEYIQKGLALGDGARKDLLYNQAAACEGKLDFAGALQALETYKREFGADPGVEKELAFLRTRTD